MRLTPSGVEEAGAQLLPPATELLALAADLPQAERVAAGCFIEGTTAAISRHARG